MKKDIHPAYKTAKVHCNGCGISFETHSTVDSITVEICSNCHPFYTGKKKLVDLVLAALINSEHVQPLLKRALVKRS